MHEKYLLLIDLGTSGPKVAVSTMNAEVISSHFEDVKYKTFPGGGVEQSPDDWWSAIRNCVGRILKDAPLVKDGISGICISSMWSGTVAVGEDGNALMDSIIWLDTRGAEAIKEVVGGGIQAEGYNLLKLRQWLKISGGLPGLSGKDSISHILYIKKHHPEIYGKTKQFLEPKDYLNFKLSGEFSTTTDSIILHWVTDNRDLENISYSEKLLKYTGIDRKLLPPIFKPTDIVGELSAKAADELGLNKGIKIIGGTPDVYAAALGSGAVDDYSAHLYVGTSSWIGNHLPMKKASIPLNIASLPSAIPDKYFVVAEQETAGECLKYLRDKILFPNDEFNTSAAPKEYFELLNKAAATIPPGSDKLIFTPWLCGERCPVDDPYMRGGFHNQGIQTTRSHMVRSVLEGVSFNTRWLMENVEKFNKQKFSSINYIGGGAVSDLWCQIMADILGCNINQMEEPINANIKGVAWLAAVGLGESDFMCVPKSIKSKQTFSPNSNNRNLYNELFENFKSIYKNNKKMYRKLNG